MERKGKKGDLSHRSNLDYPSTQLFNLFSSEDIRVSGIEDCQSGNVVHFSTGCSESSIVARVKVDFYVAEHGVILNLGFSDCWAIGRDEDQLGLSIPDLLDCALKAQD